MALIPTFGTLYIKFGTSYISRAQILPTMNRSVRQQRSDNTGVEVLTDTESEGGEDS